METQKLIARNDGLFAAVISGTSAAIWGTLIKVHQTSAFLLLQVFPCAILILLLFWINNPANCFWLTLQLFRLQIMRIINFIPAFIWLIISIVLLTLPANDLPHSRLFDLPNFDKIVHFGMFFMLTVLFCFPFLRSSTEVSLLTSMFNKVALYVILYGIIMEFVQKYFTVGRSFDFADILFDALGSCAGLIAVRQYMHKKIGPNKNRGRNQN